MAAAAAPRLFLLSLHYCRPLHPGTGYDTHLAKITRSWQKFRDEVGRLCRRRLSNNERWWVLAWCLLFVSDVPRFESRSFAQFCELGQLRELAVLRAAIEGRLRG